VGAKAISRTESPQPIPDSHVLPSAYEPRNQLHARPATAKQRLVLPAWLARGTPTTAARCSARNWEGRRGLGLPSLRSPIPTGWAAQWYAPVSNRKMRQGCRRPYGSARQRLLVLAESIPLEATVVLGFFPGGRPWTFDGGLAPCPLGRLIACSCLIPTPARAPQCTAGPVGYYTHGEPDRWCRWQRSEECCAKFCVPSGRQRRAACASAGGHTIRRRPFPMLRTS